VIAMLRMTKDARNIWRDAGLESIRRQDGYLGAEHILLALLSNPSGIGVAVTGVSLEDAREALHRLDDQALAAIGISIETPDSMRKRRQSRMSVTDSVKRMLVGARREAERRGAKSIDTRHFMLAIVNAERPNLALRLLEELGRDPVRIRAALDERAAS
jgi:ATP-dependent Clp protease ATP-binding subunit ClpA